MKLNTKAEKTISVFQLTAVFSMLFALVGFSYNVWRMEVTEYNSNIRSASFELLLQLSELENIVYAAHYDQNTIEGSPRKGWIKVNFIADLSMITEPYVEQSALALKLSWQQNWEDLETSHSSVTTIVEAIDHTRGQVRVLLSQLH